ncbi:hypothetical protein DVW01_12860 [Enterococcus faecium]|nr:hypothetical protein DMB17_12085 [Enterococcus faecium]RCF85235.1 hypothetical protein B1172_01755 [Enterococcus faecium]RCF86868.1 hypothetical protein B1141_16095 [Enterococcus faecium]RCF87550.1 hypothetical protein B1142_08660 [Enterococcus faecium]RCG04960.1 hypothetical protein B1144_04190 [Enterococcus faecium]
MFEAKRLKNNLIDGVQKIASTALSPACLKIWRAIFHNHSLMLDADQLFQNLIPPHQISFVPQSSDLLGHPHTALVHLGSETS